MRYKAACIMRPTCALHLARAWATNCGKLPRKSGNRTLCQDLRFVPILPTVCRNSRLIDTRGLSRRISPLNVVRRSRAQRERERVAALLEAIFSRTAHVSDICRRLNS